MSKKIRTIVSGIIAIVLIVLGDFFLSLLSNYASNNVPISFQNNPVLLWSLIGVIIIALVIFNVFAEFRKIESSGVISSPVESKSRVLIDNAPDFTYSSQRDVFISYSDKDSQFVYEKLLPFLNRHFFTYWYNKEDFQAGSTRVEEIERCIKESSHVILILTKNYFESEWGKFENIMAQTLDPGAAFRKVIPVLIEDCELPVRLQILHYRDLRLDHQSQWDLLARDLA